MSGAYVAKPADAVASTLPPGWTIGWTFPGPYPPGYAPVLTMVMTADDTLAFDGTATVTGSARDNSTYATNEPSVMTWTAAISGSPVSLRFNGDPSYSSSLSSAVSFGTYWGATPSIEFELTADNADDVVVLTGSYVLDGVRIENTESITISVPIVKVVITFTLSSVNQGESLWYAYVDITEGDDTPNLWINGQAQGTTPSGPTRISVNGENDAYALGEVTLGPYTDYSGGSTFTDESGLSRSESGSLTLTVLQDGYYRIRLFPFTIDYDNSTVVANVKFYDSDDNLLAEYDETATVQVSPVPFWLEFDTATGVITETEIL